VSRTPDEVTQQVLKEAVCALQQCVEKIRHCLAQLSAEQVWWRPEPSMNSIGNLVLHLTGNLRQWVVAGLGGEPDIRDRPAEFSQRVAISGDALLESLVRVVDDSARILSKLSAAEMSRTRRIQGFDVTGWAALFDTVPHFKGHTQEITSLTRMQLGSAYQFHWQPETIEQGAPRTQ